ncbi:AMP-binding protein [Oceanicella actignis]|uniref:AMP-binding protein n=1 Tax=Oceanicella actignis TaxID=1189325 RepID=UPI0011E760F4|nr:AMP-binding protein [Oceanicella actignis]TYO84806.1 crotonobetaine/carnitine-CoA ligase [Oceanicella actignis]
MIDPRGMTIGQAAQAAAARWPRAPLFCAPPDPGRAWDPEGRELTQAAVAEAAAALAERLAAAGYGRGHRAALDLENRPEHLVWKLALAALGISCVPINPDLRPAEVAYILADSDPQLCVAAPNRRAALAEAIALGEGRALIAPDEPPPPAPARPRPGAPAPEDEASVIYTSGTTGKPKGCLLSHEYELELGRWYLTCGGLMAMTEGERLYNPLPLFHVNAGILSLTAMMLSGGCQIQPARFSRGAWWRDIRACRASIAHYLGVVIPALMAAEPSADERAHALRFMVGAGVEPTLHAPAEARFGVPLIEVWGMTEMCRIIAANEEPRRIDTRAFGRPRPGLEVRVVDDQDRDVAPGEPGEMVLRHSADAPRRGFFSGYLNKPEATAEAWRGGWFHTGDTVRMEPDGTLIFVDRKKNIIRRSGENIAAAEVEACLLEHPDVAQAAALAAPDPIRDEEVFAAVVLKPGRAADADMARRLFDWCMARMAYYKAPGWVLFMDALPVTGTQKVRKHDILPPGVSPQALPGAIDLRAAKKR